MKTKISNCIHILTLCGLFIMLGTGCTTYEQQSKVLRKHWGQGAVLPASTEAGKYAKSSEKGKDAVVWRLEQATALRAAGQFKESNDAFTQAEEKIDDYEQKAKVSVSREAAALLSNQANLPYVGRDYDKVMLNTYKALNFLQLGEPDKARVELTRAHQRQQDTVENNKRRIEKTEEEAEKLKESKDKQGKPIKGADKGKEMADKAKDDERFKQQMSTNYTHLDGLKAYADYVNPFTVYLDGLLFMTGGTGGSDLERARKSFERMVGFNGENKFTKQDLEAVEQSVRGEGMPPTTYVIFETGRAPIRGQIPIYIPLFLVGVRNVPYVDAAFPTLKFQEGHSSGLSVTAGGTTETTVLLSSMDTVVGQAFKDELPTIITKTLISTAVKATAQFGVNKAMENEDAMARLFIKILLAVVQASVNIADTRTWTTLPKEFQYCRIPTPADRKIELSAVGGAQKSEVTVAEGTVNLVYVKSISTTNNSPLIVTQTKLK